MDTAVTQAAVAKRGRDVDWVSRAVRALWPLLVLALFADEYRSASDLIRILNVWDRPKSLGFSFRSLVAMGHGGILLVQAWLAIGMGAALLCVLRVQPRWCSVIVLLVSLVTVRALGPAASANDRVALMAAIILTLSIMTSSARSRSGQDEARACAMALAVVALIAIRCARVICWLPQRPTLLTVTACGMLSGLLGAARPWRVVGVAAAAVFATTLATVSRSWALGTALLIAYVAAVDDNRIRERATPIGGGYVIGGAASICVCLAALESIALVATLSRRGDVLAKTETVLHQVGFGGGSLGPDVTEQALALTMNSDRTPGSLQLEGTDRRAQRLLRALDAETTANRTGPVFAGFMRAYCRRFGGGLGRLGHGTLTIDGRARLLGHFDCSQ